LEVAENREILNKYLASYGLSGDIYFEEPITGPAASKEGRTKQITVNIYERNSIVRAKCIEHHGAVCQVCDLDFETKYGKMGKGFIHVHHLIELSTIGDDYEVDPVHDLLPVCPNCHAMLHKRQPAYLVRELWKLMNKGLQPASYAKHWGFGG
jgi:5-methylcytosine-specific restriction protein A